MRCAVTERHRPFIYPANIIRQMVRPAAGIVTIALVTATVAIRSVFLAGQAPSTLSLNDAMARAIEANRTILAARSARAIGVAGIQAAGQRPNPEVSFEVARETPHWAFTGTVPDSRRE